MSKKEIDIDKERDKVILKRNKLITDSENLSIVEKELEEQYLEQVEINRQEMVRMQNEIRDMDDRLEYLDELEIQP